VLCRAFQVQSVKVRDMRNCLLQQQALMPVLLYYRDTDLLQMVNVFFFVDSSASSFKIELLFQARVDDHPVHWNAPVTLENGVQKRMAPLHA